MYQTLKTFALMLFFAAASSQAAQPTSQELYAALGQADDVLAPLLKAQIDSLKAAQYRLADPILGVEYKVSSGRDGIERYQYRVTFRFEKPVYIPLPSGGHTDGGTLVVSIHVSGTVSLLDDVSDLRDIKSYRYLTISEIKTATEYRSPKHGHGISSSGG